MSMYKILRNCMTRTFLSFELRASADEITEGHDVIKVFRTALLLIDGKNEPCPGGRDYRRRTSRKERKLMMKRCCSSTAFARSASSTVRMPLEIASVRM